jgi:hypothetical protein
MQPGLWSVLFSVRPSLQPASDEVRVSNRLKNRYAAPQQIDPAIMLTAMMAPGRDTGRWKVKQEAEIVGYVFDVKVGGIESTNGSASAAEQRDTHIELVLDPMAGSLTQRVIVEVTPRWRATPAAHRDGLVNAGVARQAAGALDQGRRLDAVRRGTPEWVREHGSGSRAQLESDRLGDSPGHVDSRSCSDLRGGDSVIASEPNQTTK